MRPIVSDLSADEVTVARARTLVGQPVKLGQDNFSAIRCALGADMLIESFFPEDLSTSTPVELGTALGSNGLGRLLSQVTSDC